MTNLDSRRYHTELTSTPDIKANQASSVSRFENRTRTGAGRGH